MDHLLICSCGEVLVKSQQDVVKLRSKILLFRNGKAFAVCKGCNKEYPVPVQLDQELMKSLKSSATHPRLFVSKSH
jgi:hypothetical protein